LQEVGVDAAEAAEAAARVGAGRGAERAGQRDVAGVGFAHEPVGRLGEALVGPRLGVEEDGAEHGAQIAAHAGAVVGENRRDAREVGGRGIRGDEPLDELPRDEGADVRVGGEKIERVGEVGVAGRAGIGRGARGARGQ
jgi:hypothetical protein